MQGVKKAYKRRLTFRILRLKRFVHTLQLLLSLLRKLLFSFLAPLDPLYGVVHVTICIAKSRTFQ